MMRPIYLHLCKTELANRATALTKDNVREGVLIAGKPRKLSTDYGAKNVTSIWKSKRFPEKEKEFSQKPHIQNPDEIAK